MEYRPPIMNYANCQVESYEANINALDALAGTKRPRPTGITPPEVSMGNTAPSDRRILKPVVQGGSRLVP